MKLEIINIPRQNRGEGLGVLDPVTAFLQDFGPGRGQLTLVQWGRAWSYYWGAMGGVDLRTFIGGADTGYIVGKLMLTPDVILKRAEARDEFTLTKIVAALKQHIRQVPRAGDSPEVTVLRNALLKACGDDAKVAEAYIESQR